MKYYIIAGEASGDLHGSNLIKELKKVDAAAEIYCWGGDLMQAAGGVVRKHLKELAFMGFAEVIMNFKKILKNFSFCKKDVSCFQPDTLILIDYPGFNLKIAKWAKKKGIKVIYYIAPQVWAWNKSRVKEMKKNIDKLITILPFEKDFFEKHGLKNVEYVGHPLLDAIDIDSISPLTIDNSKPIIALLPGSRKQEIISILPHMLSVIDDFPDHQFIIGATKNQSPELYYKYTSGKNVEIVFDQTYSLLKSAQAALVKSGTGTLETAIIETPEVMCYRGNPISYKIAKWLIKDIKYICLVNLIMDKPAVTELIQNDLNKINIQLALSEILSYKLSIIKSDYKELKKLLGEKGASFRAATSIKNTL